jgi:hypothetical protein
MEQDVRDQFLPRGGVGEPADAQKKIAEHSGTVFQISRKAFEERPENRTGVRDLFEDEQLAKVFRPTREATTESGHGQCHAPRFPPRGLEG